MTTLREAAEALLTRYVELVNSGDCGFWDPEKAEEVKSLRAALVERKAEPVACEWRHGAPQKPWSDEWFIAETTYGYRVVLRSLPEDWTYDFKTADDTYIKADKIKRWMQFPDSHYVTPPAAPVADTSITKLYMEAAKAYRGYDHDFNGDGLMAAVKTVAAALSASPSPVDSRDELIERLVKALEPFAKLGDDGWGSACPSERVLAVWWADDDKDPHKTKRPHITQGDIRNARRVLLAAKEQQP